MNRNEIRSLINNYIETNCVKTLSSSFALALKKLLKETYPNKEYGNFYRIDCDYDEDSIFTEKLLTGKIDRCDPFEPTHIIDSVSFSINESLEVMCYDKNFSLNLKFDMNNLSKDDLIDIKNLDYHNSNDIYFAFMRIKEEDRGKLAYLIPHCLNVFNHDIPPYAFYKYEGLFFHTTNRAVGDIGGGVGVGGFIKEEGPILEIDYSIVSIGRNAFDGCKNLTKVYLKHTPFYIGKHAFSNIPGLEIYCSIQSKPNAWDDEWCDKDCKIYWGSLKN